MPLSPEDQAVVDTVRRDGVAILHDLLTPEEVDAARTEFDALQIEAGRGEWDAPENAGTRTVLCTCQHVPVGATPALGGCISHPRIVAIAEALLHDECYVEMMRTNLYMPGHPGMFGHSDGQMTIP